MAALGKRGATIRNLGGRVQGSGFLKGGKKERNEEGRRREGGLWGEGGEGGGGVGRGGLQAKPPDVEAN